jgi:hypothetical protein
VLDRRRNTLTRLRIRPGALAAAAAAGSSFGAGAAPAGGGATAAAGSSTTAAAGSDGEDPAAALRLLLRRRAAQFPDVDLQSLAVGVVKVSTKLTHYTHPGIMNLAIGTC